MDKSQSISQCCPAHWPSWISQLPATSPPHCPWDKWGKKASLLPLLQSTCEWSVGPPGTAANGGSKAWNTSGGCLFYISPCLPWRGIYISKLVHQFTLVIDLAYNLTIPQIIKMQNYVFTWSRRIPNSKGLEFIPSTTWLRWIKLHTEWKFFTVCLGICKSSLPSILFIQIIPPEVWVSCFKNKSVIPWFKSYRSQGTFIDANGPITFPYCQANNCMICRWCVNSVMIWGTRLIRLKFNNTSVKSAKGRLSIYGPFSSWLPLRLSLRLAALMVLMWILLHWECRCAVMIIGNWEKYGTHSSQAPTIHFLIAVQERVQIKSPLLVPHGDVSEETWCWLPKAAGLASCPIPPPHYNTWLSVLINKRFISTQQNMNVPPVLGTSLGSHDRNPNDKTCRLLDTEEMASFTYPCNVLKALAEVRLHGSGVLCLR